MLKRTAIYTFAVSDIVRDDGDADLRVISLLSSERFISGVEDCTTISGWTICRNYHKQKNTGH